MSAPRWTLARYLDDNRRVLLSNDQPVLVLSLLDNHATGRILEAETVARRIVALLNATELASDALALLQATCMHSAAMERAALDGSPEQGQRVIALDALTDTLNHTVRMYVELDEEPSLQLEDTP